MGAVRGVQAGEGISQRPSLGGSTGSGNGEPAGEGKGESVSTVYCMLWTVRTEMWRFQEEGLPPGVPGSPASGDRRDPGPGRTPDMSGHPKVSQGARWVVDPGHQ